MPKKQKSGLYRAGIKTPDGKTKWLSAKSVAELEQKKADIAYTTRRGIYADDVGYTVGEWGDKWLSLYKSNTSYSTYNGYANILKNHINPIKNIRLKDLKKSDIQECINNASGHYDIQRRIKLTLNQMLESAIDDGLLYRNVSKAVHVPVKQSSGHRALTVSERSIIPKLDLSTKERAFVYILWYTGMRPEEARALTVNDIDLAHDTITVSKAAAFESNKVIVRPPKTASGNRCIDILEPLKAPLCDYLKELDNLYLFTQKDGNLMSRTAYRRFWTKIYNKINEALGGNSKIKATDLTPYVFRHEYATILYYSEVDVKEAARLMGHRDIRMILDVYAELDAGKSNSKGKLDQYLSEAY